MINIPVVLLDDLPLLGRSSLFMKTPARLRDNTWQRVDSLHNSVERSRRAGPRTKSNTLFRHYSKKVNRFVCKMFIARVASWASITHEILISLAPKQMSVLISNARDPKVANVESVYTTLTL